MLYLFRPGSLTNLEAKLQATAAYSEDVGREHLTVGDELYTPRARD